MSVMHESDLADERQRLADVLAAVDWSHEQPDVMRQVIGSMLSSLSADDLFNVLVLMRWSCLALPALQAATSAKGEPME